MSTAQIMIVEDEAIVAASIQRTVEKLGYTVTAVSASGEEALEQAVTTRPDLVLMDIVLSGPLDGVETAARLRVQGDIPVVYLTAYADEATLQRAKMTVPLGYILKPFDESELRATIEMALHRQDLEVGVQESQDRLRATLYCLGDAVVTTDASDRVTFMSPVAESLTGWSQSEAMTRDVGDVLHLISADTREMLESPTALALQKRMIVRFGGLISPTLLIARDGTEIAIDDSAAPIITNHAGVPIGAVVIFKDITQVERLEAQKRQAHKMQAIGTLAGGIAHEFNNSLTTMLGFSELNLLLLRPDSREWKYTQEVIAAGKRAKDLVEDILAFSHPNKQALGPVALAPLVRDAVRLLQATMPATVVVRQELAADVGEVMVNPRNIHQIIMNLGANAEHAMRASDGVLTVCLDAIEVDVPFASERSELSPGAYCRLTVEDTGHGMTSDIVSHIFEPFFTTKEIGEGTGMGLAIIHGLVISAKGEIVVESVPGQGTAFIVYLPRLDEASV